MNDVTESSNVEASPGNARIIYILYLVGLVFGITALVGLVMAYINKNDAPQWLQTHYQFQIRTFWIGLMFLVVAVITFAVVIGIFVYLFWVVWVIVRAVKGLQALEKKEAVANPTSWMFS